MSLVPNISPHYTKWCHPDWHWNNNTNYACLILDLCIHQIPCWYFITRVFNFAFFAIVKKIAKFKNNWNRKFKNDWHEIITAHTWYVSANTQDSSCIFCCEISLRYLKSFFPICVFLVYLIKKFSKVQTFRKIKRSWERLNRKIWCPFFNAAYWNRENKTPRNNVSPKSKLSTKRYKKSFNILCMFVSFLKHVSLFRYMKRGQKS